MKRPTHHTWYISWEIWKYDNQRKSKDVEGCVCCLNIKDIFRRDLRERIVTDWGQVILTCIRTDSQFSVFSSDTENHSSLKKWTNEAAKFWVTEVCHKYSYCTRWKIFDVIQSGQEASVLIASTFRKIFLNLSVMLQQKLGDIKRNFRYQRSCAWCKNAMLRHKMLTKEWQLRSGQTVLSGPRVYLHLFGWGTALYKFCDCYCCHH